VRRDAVAAENWTHSLQNNGKKEDLKYSETDTSENAAEK
jgi:hypothetical protein